jgi:two-component system LytT family response regulator
MLRALIVDDEPIARQVLRDELEAQKDVEIVGEAANGLSALEQIAALHPDVVFLDLQMPGLTGFEVIQRMPLGAHVPVVIVVTAYDQHAIEALDAGAIDYLLKPLREARLIKALDRARQLIAKPPVAADTAGEAPAAVAPQPVRKIVGRLGDEYFLLSPSDVLAFQADGELVWIVTAKQRYLATERLRTIQQKLAGSSFERVHRGALVNVDHVRKMAALSSNRWLITLRNNQEFIVSKRLARNVRQILSW